MNTIISSFTFSNWRNNWSYFRKSCRTSMSVLCVHPLLCLGAIKHCFQHFSLTLDLLWSNQTSAFHGVLWVKLWEKILNLNRTENALAGLSRISNGEAKWGKKPHENEYHGKPRIVRGWIKIGTKNQVKITTRFVFGNAKQDVRDDFHVSPKSWLTKQNIIQLILIMVNQKSYEYSSSGEISASPRITLCSPAASFRSCTLMLTIFRLNVAFGLSSFSTSFSRAINHALLEVVDPACNYSQQNYRNSKIHHLNVRSFTENGPGEASTNLWDLLKLLDLVVGHDVECRLLEVDRR